GVAKIAALGSPVVWVAAPRKNWNTAKVVLPGLIGFDAKGHFSSGRLMGNVALLALPTGRFGSAALAAKASALGERGGAIARLAAPTVGAAAKVAKAAEYVTNGKWFGWDSRLLAEYVRNRHVGQLMTSPLDEVRLPEHIAGRAATAEAYQAMPRTDGVGRLAGGEHLGRFATPEQVLAEHQR